MDHRWSSVTDRTWRRPDRALPSRAVRRRPAPAAAIGAADRHWRRHRRRSAAALLWGRGRSGPRAAGGRLAGRARRRRAAVVLVLGWRAAARWRARRRGGAPGGRAAPRSATICGRRSSWSASCRGSTPSRSCRRSWCARSRAAWPRGSPRPRRAAGGWRRGRRERLASAGAGALALSRWWRWPSGGAALAGWAALGLDGRSADRQRPSRSSATCESSCSIPQYTGLPPRIIPGRRARCWRCRAPGEDRRARAGAGARRGGLIVEDEATPVVEPRPVEVKAPIAQRQLRRQARGQLPLRPRRRRAARARAGRASHGDRARSAAARRFCTRPPIRSRWPGRAASSWPTPSTTTTASATSSWCGASARRPRAREVVRHVGAGDRARRASWSGTWASSTCKPGVARRLSPRGQGQRHRSRPQRRQVAHLLSVDVEPAREARARSPTRSSWSRRRCAAGRSVEVKRDAATRDGGGPGLAGMAYR